MKHKTILVLLVLVWTVGVFPMTATLTDTPERRAVLAQGDSWLDGWDYRRTVNITGASGCGTDYQIMLDVTYHTYMQTDFDDIRFTGIDGVTLWDHWLESKTDSVSAVFWVEVAVSLESSALGYMYFGNSTVSSASDGPATFPFFDDFNDGSINTTLWYNWQTGGSSVESGGLLTVTGAPAATETQGGKVKFGTSYAYEYRVYFFSDSQDYEAVGFDDRSDDGNVEGSGIDALEVIYASSKIYREKRENTGQDSARTTDYSSYVRLSLRRSNTSVLVYEDGDLGANLTTQVPLDDCGVWVYVRNAASIVYLDYTFVRKYVAGVVSVVGVWAENVEATLPLLLNWHPTAQFGYDMFFILAGLIMIPASTMYLVRGGRKEMSTDKIFYGLIIFFVGLGLLIGGVSP